MKPTSRLCLPALPLLALLAATAPAHAGIPANGDLLMVATPAVSPPVDHYVLVRANPVTGAVDTVAQLPTGNQPVDLDVSPVNGLVYVLAKSSIYRVDPCTGIVATITTGGYVAAPQPPSMTIFAHSNGSLYITRPGTTTGGIVRVDPVTGTQTLLTNPYTNLAVTAYGMTEGADHFLYASTVGGSGSVPWVLRVDPVTGATTVVASGVQSTNVRDIAFDTRDSLFVFRAGFSPSVHRIDRVTGQVGLLTTIPTVGTTAGWMCSHPDGGLYTPQAAGTTTFALYRLDPVSKAFVAVTSPQGTTQFAFVALMRGFSGCPTPSHRSSWGQVKTGYR